jgi:hypothetical protein
VEHSREDSFSFLQQKTKNSCNLLGALPGFYEAIKDFVPVALK